MTLRFRVRIGLKPGILDVQGAAVRRALGGMGFAEVTDLRVGKLVEVELEAPSETEGRARVEAMCAKLLANPVLEDYVVEVVPDLAAPRSGR